MKYNRCVGCGVMFPVWILFDDSASGHPYCRECLTTMHHDRMPIPEGCAYRFLFYWWLFLTGKLSDFPDSPRLLPENLIAIKLADDYLYNSECLTVTLDLNEQL